MMTEEQPESTDKAGAWSELKRGFKEGVQEEADKKKKKKSLSGSFVFGALMGVAGYFFGKYYLGDPDSNAININLDSMLLLSVAFIYGIIMVFLTIGLLMPMKFRARFLNMVDDDEFVDERPKLIYSTIAAFVMIVGMVLLALSGDNLPFAPVIGASAYIISLGIYAVGSFMLWPKYDELMRQLADEAAAYTCYLVFMVLSIWCALAATQFVPIPGPLTIIALFHGIYIAIIFWQTHKRGLADH